MKEHTWISKIIKLILVLAVIGAVLAYVYTVLTPSSGPVSYIISSAQTHALVIDMDANNQINVATVLNDQDVILTFHTGATATGHKNDMIQSEAMLAHFDENHDGIIDARDPDYSRFELMFFERTPDGLKVRYAPLAQAGVRALFINSKYLPYELHERLNKLHHVVGGVVMADGSTRLMRDIVLDEYFLKAVGSK